MHGAKKIKLYIWIKESKIIIELHWTRGISLGWYIHNNEKGVFMKHVKIWQTLLLVAVFGLNIEFASAGDSGCGLGAVIIQKNSKGLQLLSMTTNSFFFTQPLGIISGTSGCSSSGIVKNEKEMQYFVEINHDDLTREMSKGEGEKLNTLARLNGCETKESQAQFSEMTKHSFGEIVPSAETTSTDLIKNLRTKISTDSHIQKLCASI